MPEKDKTADYPVGPDGKKLKPCCVCPETKKVRDECIMDKVRGRRSGVGPFSLRYFLLKGEENCGHLIEAHKACMRYFGFKI